MAVKYGLPTPARAFKIWAADLFRVNNVVAYPGVAKCMSSAFSCSAGIVQDDLDLYERIKRVEDSIKSIEEKMVKDKRELLDKIELYRSRLETRIDEVANDVSKISDAVKSDRVSSISDGRIAFVVFSFGSVLTTFSQEIAGMICF